MLKQTLALVGLTLSLSANAVIVNTIGGVDYQWLELSHTQGLSRNAVEARLLDSNDELYGYQYASREQVEQLFFSYASFDGLNGYHGEAAVVEGVKNLISDFGPTYTNVLTGTRPYSTVDGYEVIYTRSNSRISALYGGEDECGPQLACWGQVYEYGTMVSQDSTVGWDATDGSPLSYLSGVVNEDIASFLVAPAAVPVPAAGWLFMSALVGLVGKKRLARR